MIYDTKFGDSERVVLVKLGTGDVVVGDAIADDDTVYVTFTNYGEDMPIGSRPVYPEGHKMEYDVAIGFTCIESIEAVERAIARAKKNLKIINVTSKCDECGTYLNEDHSCPECHDVKPKK